MCVCCWSLSDKKRKKEKREKMSDTPCDDLRKGKSAVIPPSVKSQALEVLDARCCSLRVRPFCMWCQQFLVLFCGVHKRLIRSSPPLPPLDPPPPPDRPKFRSFFFLLPPQISLFMFSQGVFSLNLGGVFEVYWGISVIFVTICRSEVKGVQSIVKLFLAFWSVKRQGRGDGRPPRNSSESNNKSSRKKQQKQQQ